MALLGLYDRSLIGRASQAALTYEDAAGVTTSWTFGELEARSNRVAAVLRARGLRAGDRLALYLVNQPAFIDLWLACVKLGVIVVPINVLYREREIAHIVHDAAPVAVVTTAEQAALLPADTVPWDVGTLGQEAESASDARPAVHADSETPAALVYTSGTTGASKGAILTHGNFAANALALVQAWEVTADDRYLAVLPLFHVHGLANGVHLWLLSGCHMTLVERFAQERAADWFLTHRPTLFFGVPTMFVRLLALPEDTAREIGAHMRLFVSGSAPLPAPVLEAFRARYGQVILERYGMTETLMNVSNPYHGERRAGTVGFPLPMTAVRLVNEAGEDVPDGTSGEVLVRGPHVCAGYWRRPEATAAAFQGGWFRTGDVGVRAADGYITLEGRRSDLIISGGFNIYPREIEELLTELPGVREAAVVGVKDAVRGEVPVAYLVCDDTVAVDRLASTLRAQIASFKVPRAFVRVDGLPRTALGKVQRHLLPPWTLSSAATDA
ncbi:MAG: class I adenylate-forming enzyme family protein [Gemmatimonas sp.]|uniref:class I adenylate-forming enzyme family protein n=1 Tax=Gemmatimonas sp. TaxID=1962908 RepID=UPI00391F6524